MKVALLATGGTIAGASPDPLDFKDYKAGKYPVDQVLASMPQVQNIADITIEQLERVSSSDISVTHWVQLKRRVEYYLNELGYDGVVITHGTNTLEETAYFLHLTVNSSKPVVLVGSQRPFTAIGSDAAINLLNALRVAACSEARHKGVLVVLNDEINSAREVTKTNTYRLETFQSGQLGILGYVDVDQSVQFYRLPTRRHTVDSSFSRIPLDDLPDVAILYSYAGASGDLIRMVTQSSNYKGIVMAAGGAGRLSRAEKEALILAVKKGMGVVRSSRVGNGRVVELAQYGGCGFIAGDNLIPQKARILLMLSLQSKTPQNQLQEIFNTY